MPGTVIGTSLNLGYVGKISRNVDNIITSRAVKSILDGNGAETLQAIPFGKLVVINTDNSFSKFGDSGSGVSAATLALTAGIAVGEVKQMTTYALGANAGAAQYEPGQPCDVLERGTTTVFIKAPTTNAPTAGGKVYTITALNSNSVFAVGDLFASATPTGYDTGGTATLIELTNMRWKSGKVDANGVAEISILTRTNP